MQHHLRSDDTRLVIPFPERLERQYGALSLSAVGLPISIRMHKDDVDMLNREAVKLGMSSSAIVRWCSVYGVQQLAFVRTGKTPVVRP